MSDKISYRQTRLPKKIHGKKIVPLRVGSDDRIIPLRTGEEGREMEFEDWSQRDQERW